VFFEIQKSKKLLLVHKPLEVHRWCEIMLQQLGVTCDSTPVLKRKKGGCSEHKVVTFQFASDWVNILFEQVKQLTISGWNIVRCKDIRALWRPRLSAERQSVWMSKTTNDGLTRSDTGCFMIAVPTTVVVKRLNEYWIGLNWKINALCYVQAALFSPCSLYLQYYGRNPLGELVGN